MFNLSFFSQKRKVQIPNKPQNMHMMVGKDRPLDLTSMLIPGANSITIKQNACACVSVVFSNTNHDKIESLMFGKTELCFWYYTLCT
jgi:hypothetical protein